jgi:hypothetical protein
MAGTVVADTLQSSITGTPVQFNDGTGTQIGTLCRAWVNFNGTGTVAIRASFNVTSITDNGTGDYTVNFTTAMSDANYSWELNVQNYSGGDSTICMAAAKNVTAPTTSALRVGCLASGVGPFDPPHVVVAIFR